MSIADLLEHASGWKFGRRAGGTLAFLLQLFVVGIVPVLDARVEAAGAASYAHVEESGSNACAPTHDPFNCQLCRVLRAPETPAEGATLAVVVVVTPPPPSAAMHSVARSTWRGTVTTRGPPTLS